MTVKEKEAKKAKSSGVRLPSKGLYNFALPILNATHGKRYNLTIRREGLEDLKPPYVVLCNHVSRIDWILVGLSMKPDYVNVVITRYYYSIPALRFFLKKLGTIPKDQFSPDVKAVKSMLAAAKLGGNVMLFPEGRMAPGGVSESFEKSTVKLLRHLKLPVVGIHLYGAYMTFPKWAKNMRKGRIDAEVKVMLTPEKMAEMTDDQIYETMVESLKTDEFAWQEKNRVAFKGKKLAEGLHDVLFLCPKCGSEHTMTTKKDVIRCKECGNGARLNKYYDLLPLDEGCVIPKNIGQWYNMQVDHVRGLIDSQPDIFMTDTAELLMPGEKTWLRNVGRGIIRADAAGFSYKGEKNGQPFELFVPVSALPAMAFSQGNSIELYYKGEFYSFEPSRPVECQRWSMFVEQMHLAQAVREKNGEEAENSAL